MSEVTGPSAAASVPPRRVPAVGQVLTLAVRELRYRRAPLRFRVSRVREDISGWYGGEWVGLEGRELDTAGHPICRQQILVAVAVVERHFTEQP